MIDLPDFNVITNIGMHKTGRREVYKLDGGERKRVVAGRRAGGNRQMFNNFSEGGAMFPVFRTGKALGRLLDCLICAIHTFFRGFAIQLYPR